MEAEDICLDIWVQAPLAFGAFGSRREVLNVPEMLVRLVGSGGATLAGNPQGVPHFIVSIPGPRVLDPQDSGLPRSRVQLPGT